MWLRIIHAVVLVVCSASLFAQNIQGPVSYWPADYNTTDVIGGFNGTLVGGATFTTGYTGGEGDGAFSLNGNGYVDITSSN